jgi:hypothetical protein
MGAEVMVTDQVPDTDLLDLVTYTSFYGGNTKTAQNETYTAEYIITGKVLHIEIGNYWEKYILYSTGLNKEVDSQGAQAL